MVAQTGDKESGIKAVAAGLERKVRIKNPLYK